MGYAVQSKAHDDKMMTANFEVANSALSSALLLCAC